ncbi:MAG TPA: tRNA pseudouridine(55) synthase TruB [Candidatus Eisenbacteria bacterium]|nr:tRNA pseudouridine(55) synthase TruB [Candidatus Eisenbacteria bacterium]
MDGILVVAKPAGPTSHDVVALVRRLASTRRIGHGGTLDPFASGVLPLFLGQATRLVEYHLGDTKDYRATVCFGATSTTDDLAGELSPVLPAADRLLTREQVAAEVATFEGPQLQQPPVYSAISVRGRKAYAIARAGEMPELAPRAVTIQRIELMEWDDRDPSRPIAVIEVRCSAGTYIRAVARDVGARVGSGAYLGALARTASGPFRLADALGLDAIRAAAADGEDGVRALLLPADAGLEVMPSLQLTAAEIRDAAQGRFVRPEAGVAALPEETPLRLLDADGRIVGIGHRDGRRIAPEKMLVGVDRAAPASDRAAAAGPAPTG